MICKPTASPATGTHRLYRQMRRKKAQSALDRGTFEPFGTLRVLGPGRSHHPIPRHWKNDTASTSCRGSAMLSLRRRDGILFAHRRSEERERLSALPLRELPKPALGAGGQGRKIENRKPRLSNSQPGLFKAEIGSVFLMAACRFGMAPFRSDSAVTAAKIPWSRRGTKLRSYSSHHSY
jgi:hypothetical protein